MATAINPTPWKLDHTKSRLFVQIPNDLTKWQPFVGISNGWAYRFKIPFEIWTICNPTFFDYLKSRLVQISDPYCTGIQPPFNLPIHNFCRFCLFSLNFLRHSAPPAANMSFLFLFPTYLSAHLFFSIFYLPAYIFLLTCITRASGCSLLEPLWRVFL